MSSLLYCMFIKISDDGYTNFILCAANDDVSDIFMQTT